ncbi:MAG: nucleotide sugar dehydrogenase [Symbiobacterium thermophilum]|uniref:Nucleotide sugar dehydrogenase n=2 Tax=Symbiobacterium thermophilum TaxID=2734 RepID=A0A953I9A2_SYMTR|nr:nucleotide sugar dehydrogenase [Symbiobacterium thermophilum]
MAVKVCVVGVGNIGTNLLTSLRRKGVQAVGVEINPDRRAALAAAGVDGVFAGPDEAGAPDVWILTTSTGPGMSHILSAVRSLSPKPGALVSVESTLPVGGTARLAEAFRERGYVPGETFHLAHVPHRILFGVEETVFDAPRVVAGVTSACRDAAIAFYRPLVPVLYPVDDVRVAELSKIVENGLRYLNIAFAEALFGYCLEHGLDWAQLHGAVNTKPNVELLNVDFGIGGECLPKDMGFLQEALQSPLLEAAVAADEAHRARLRRLAGPHRRVLVMGLTFKPGFPDTRFSRARELAEALAADGKEVYVYDPALGPEKVTELGFRWGDPGGAYDLIYQRPLAIRTAAEEEKRGQDTRDGQ